VTKSALTQARRFLSYKAFSELSDHFIEQFYRNTNTKKWNGYRLLAIDGSTLRLHGSDELKNHFGGQKKENDIIPMARLSSSYDVMNGITHDLQIAPYNCSERDLAAMHLMKSKPEDLMIYDRGYPAFWLFALHRQHQRDFCMRIPRSFGPQFDAFIESSKTDLIIQLSATKQGKTKCRQLGIEFQPVSIRLLKVILSTGEIEVLATSLLDQKRSSKHEFKALYHSRWGVEEDYKTQKRSLEIENFSGLTVHSVLQDLHAKVFVKNIILAASTLAQKEVEEIYSDRKYAYQVNKNQAISRMKYFFVKLKNSINPIKLFESLIQLLIKTVEPIRKQRHYPRVHKKSSKKFHITIKRTR